LIKQDKILLSLLMTGFVIISLLFYGNLISLKAAPAQALDKENESTDPSFDLIYHLAMAYRAADRLKAAGVELLLSGRPLIFPHLIKAHREALHIRSTRTPKELLNVSKISKLGRLNG